VGHSDIDDNFLDIWKEPVAGFPKSNKFFLDFPEKRSSCCTKQSALRFRDSFCFAQFINNDDKIMLSEFVS